MSDQDYVYAVFRDSDKTVSVVESLNKAGMPSSQICVLGNKSEQFNQLAGRIDDPTGRYFIMFGLGGGIAGLLAGVSMALHIPGAYGFQIIVPLMATIAGASVFPYFCSLIGAFLVANKPQHWASVFEGQVVDGSIIVMAEPQNELQRVSAMEIFMDAKPIEMIFRRKPWGVSAEMQPEVQVQVQIEPAKETAKDKERRLTAVA
jgi:hypothetical protein